MKKVKFSKWIYLIFIFSALLVSCDDNGGNSAPPPPLPSYSFSFMVKSLSIVDCEITNKGKIDGNLYVFEIRLTDGNDTEIYIKLFSAVKNIFQVYNMSFGQYSPESYVKINSDVYHLSEGDLSISNNTLTMSGTGFHFSLDSKTVNGHSIRGGYEGTYRYIDESAENNNFNPMGEGYVTSSYGDFDTTFQLSSGVIFYKGLNTNREKIYDLFLTNEYEDYIHFSFSTATDLSAASFSNVICDYPFVRMQGGNGRDINTINGMFSRIRKENDKYIVRIDCYHPAGIDDFPVKGNYTGDLHFVDLISEQ